MQGRGEVRCQVERVGYFAQVIVDVYANTSLSVVSQNISARFEEYADAARFGIAYAAEHCRYAGKETSYRVEIMSINGHAVDTAQAVVALAACLAFWDAIGFVSETPPSISAEAGLVCFPR